MQLLRVNVGKHNQIEQKYWSHSHDFPIEEIWNTECILASLIAPRLRAFKALNKHGFPPDMHNMRQWNSTIQKMIDAFDLLSETKSYSENEEQTITEGLDLFHRHFRNLWD